MTFEELGEDGGFEDAGFVSGKEIQEFEENFLFLVVVHGDCVDEFEENVIYFLVLLLNVPG